MTNNVTFQSTKIQSLFKGSNCEKPSWLKKFEEQYQNSQKKQNNTQN